MKPTTLLLAGLCLLFIQCSNKKTSPEQIRNELLNWERTHPGQYIKIENMSTAQKQVLAEERGLIVEGDIINKASIANYKDVTISINYLSQTGAILKSQKEIIREYLDVNNPHHFNYHVSAPEETASFSVTLVSAVPI